MTTDDTTPPDENPTDERPYSTETMIQTAYTELKKLAIAKMANEKAGHTLQATALVHEAYVRIKGRDGEVKWVNKRQFFSAAAEAMRRILIDKARKKASIKGGREYDRTEFWETQIVAEDKSDDIVATNEALDRLEQSDPESALIVKLHFFAGIPFQEIADILGVNRKTVNRRWTFARSWLFKELQEE